MAKFSIKRVLGIPSFSADYNIPPRFYIEIDFKDAVVLQ